jgi:hypothetical protein
MYNTNIVNIYKTMLKVFTNKGGVVGENTESDCKELVVFYYLPENDRREFVVKWEP